MPFPSNAPRLMVPPIVAHPPPSSAERRKRGPGNDDNDSSGSSAIDSMRPVSAPRKRRRTILDAFQSITLQKDNSDIGEDGEDADSSQAVAEEGAAGDDAYTTTSSLEDPDDFDRLLSDAEEAQRKIMLELVFGPNSEAIGPRRKNDIDVKLETLIRGTIKDATTGSRQQPLDDMHVDAPYQRTFQVSTNSSPMVTELKRSSSLPNIQTVGGEAADAATMDTSN